MLPSMISLDMYIFNPAFKQGSSENDGRSHVYDRSELKVFLLNFQFILVIFSQGLDHKLIQANQGSSPLIHRPHVNNLNNTTFQTSTMFHYYLASNCYSLKVVSLLLLNTLLTCYEHSLYEILKLLPNRDHSFYIMNFRHVRLGF